MKLSSYNYDHRFSCLNSYNYNEHVLSDYSTFYPSMVSIYKYRRTKVIPSKLFTEKQITISGYSDQVINFIGKIKIGPLRLISRGT